MISQPVSPQPYAQTGGPMITPPPNMMEQSRAPQPYQYGGGSPYQRFGQSFGNAFGGSRFGQTPMGQRWQNGLMGMIFR